MKKKEIKDPGRCELCGQVTPFWRYSRTGEGTRLTCLECIKRQRKRPSKLRRKSSDLPGQMLFDFVY